MANKATNPAPAANVSNSNAAAANITSLPYGAETDGPAHKYGATAANVPCAATNYRLTGIGADSAATGNGKSGKPTAMALVAVAAKAAGATQTKAVSGLAIVTAMRTNPQVAEAWRATKAGKYAPKGALPCPNWCSGYVTGAARAAAGLLAKAA